MGFPLGYLLNARLLDHGLYFPRSLVFKPTFIVVATLSCLLACLLMALVDFRVVLESAMSVPTSIFKLFSGFEVCQLRLL